MMIMARKRSAKYDYICRRCGCPCDFERHLGGGQNMRACKRPVDPVLRSEFEAEIRRDLECLRQVRSWS
jgi:hypothetical protein